MGFYSYMDGLMLQRKVPDSEFSVLPPAPTHKNLNLLHMHAMLNTESEVKIHSCATLQHWCKIIKLVLQKPKRDKTYLTADFVPNIGFTKKFTS